MCYQVKSDCVQPSVQFPRKSTRKSCEGANGVEALSRTLPHTHSISNPSAFLERPMSIILAGPGLTLTFSRENGHLKLEQLVREGDGPFLYRDVAVSQPGGAPTGNPLAVVVRAGESAGIYGMSSFLVTGLQHDDRSLLAYLKHETLPLLLALDVEVEGNVVTWRAQACWNGETRLEADFYLPLLSRVRCASPDEDRAIFPAVSGSEQGPLGRINYRNTYPGSLSSPTFLLEGGGRGLAVLDDNRADFAADPGACVQRSYVAGMSFPAAERTGDSGGDDGPFIGVCHTRVFRPVSEGGLTDGDMQAELRDGESLPMECRGDTVDLGPVRMYAYEGSWRVGAAWLRQKRKSVPFRVSPAEWYRQTTFISEHMGDRMVSAGQSFFDYPAVLAAKRQLGSDLFHIPGFHDPEILGTTRNWLNRGDYTFAAENLGGFEAVRSGIDAVHRAGGHILYYVEGLIMWKRSRIGRSKGREWALMNADGTYDEHYRGFWHMCPACPEWRDWLALSCAEIVRSTGVDGFFIDSACATHFHRCFNPDHRHPHPDVWSWGLREMLRRVREEVDRVSPETILFVEGAGDMAREFADGFVAHSHDWTRNTFSVPLARFLHPEMRAFESWTSGGSSPDQPMHPPEFYQIRNAVTGHRIYAHDPLADRMAGMGRHVRRYYDAFPEICDNPLSEWGIGLIGPGAESCKAELFEGMPRVLTVGNLTDSAVDIELVIPAVAGILFDRVDSTRVPVHHQAHLSLKPWEFRAFELRA